MDPFSLEQLEFDALLALFDRFVASPMGKDEVRQLSPISDRAVLETTHAALDEALRYQKQVSGSGKSIVRLRFGGVPDVRDAVSKLRIEGAVLDGIELRDLIVTLERTEEIRSALYSVLQQYPLLYGKAVGMTSFSAFLQEFSGKINPDGTLADHASIALNRIRRDIEKQRRTIQDSLSKFLKAHSQDGVLQEEFVTLRDDRFVVPIVSGQRGRVDGVVHGTSGTGRTLFLEPLETIGLNNDLVRYRDDEQREVFRILRDLTDRLRRQASAIRQTVAIFTELDVLFAKADFAMTFEGSVPKFSQGKFVLRNARHPLLADLLRRERKSVTPFSLMLDDDNRILLISGPNTGGKTVTLKTVGLLALMAQCGLPVTAESAELPMFDQILADLGDHQSIAESLSSFSAHMAHVREIEAAVTHESLVILDELGRATDPEEGGALGVALIDQFRRIGAKTLVSTHLLPMKIYGANTESVVNASMGFNEETLQPTYLLRLGVPGKSAALDIAQRLGIPEPIMTRARANLTTSERDIAQFLNELHSKLAHLASEESELQKARAEVAIEKATLERQMAQREAKRIAELERRAESAIQDFEKQSKESLSDLAQLTESRRAAESAARSVARLKREFKEQITGIRHDPEAPAPPKPKEIVLEPGMRVRLRDVRDPARIRRVLNDGRIEVEAGFMKLQIGREEIREILGAGEAAPKPANVNIELGPKWNSTYSEINVVGQRAEEAVDAADKFLDDASLAGVDRVRIVHGFGMGILRKRIGELLQKNPHVAQFYPATPAEGGAGATIVELK